MDITDIKVANVQKILNTLRFSSGMTKREIAYDTGLSFSTVSNVCNDLEEMHVLYETKSNDSAVGRTPDKYYFQCARYCSICVELQQGDTLRLSVLDFANNLLFQTQQTADMTGDIISCINFIQKTYEELIRSPQFDNVQFVGIGISIPGVYDYKSGRIVNAPFSNCGEVSLREIIFQRIGLPCYIENEANLCAVAMAQKDCDKKNLLYLHSSSTLNMGAICEGNLLRGKEGYASQIAHMPIGDPDTVCPYCGGFGCIGNDLAQRGMNVFSADLSDGECVHLYEDRGKKLGRLLSVLVNIFDPQMVYIGGSGFKNYNLFQPWVMSVLESQSSIAIENGLHIEHDKQSSDTVQCGINQLIYENWIPV